MKAIFAAAILATTAITGSASAAVISSSLSLPIASGTIGGLVAGGSGTLTYSYDDTLTLAGFADAANGLLSFNLTFGSIVKNGLNATVDATSPFIAVDATGALETVVANYDFGSFAASVGNTGLVFSVLDTTGATVASGTLVAQTVVPGSVVPEPASLAVIGLALAGLTAARRRA